MNVLKLKLIGELVGLARTTDGNEHLISPRSTALIRACLAATPERDTELQELLGRVEAVKRSMVPDCFLCANPCGRNAAFDLQELDSAPEEIRTVKRRILDGLASFCESAPEPALYRCLIALGTEGLRPEFLESLINELKA